MSKRILLIDNDLGFANEVKAGLEHLGANVEVVSDGPNGLERATVSVPDLILLTIELPGMNGFLVCKKIKKGAGLSEIPLIILSSEASEETFEQHKKLKTHAEDYVHKPVTFDQLLEHVKKFISFAPQGLGFAPAIQELRDDEIVLEDENMPPLASEEPEVRLSEAPLSEPTLLRTDERNVSSSPFASEPAAAIEGPSIPAVPSAEREQIEGEPESTGQMHVAEPSPVPELLPVEEESANEELVQTLEELQRVKERLAVAERALQETKSAKAKESGISGREFLDLRERLNRKDRELLDLKDQINARDKQLVEANDNLLKIARDLEDAKDRYQALERESDKAKALIETLTSDKESAKKRGEDLKSRLERTDAKLKAREAELSQFGSARVKEIEDLKREIERRSNEEAQVHHAALNELRVTLQSDAEERIRELEGKYQTELQEARTARGRDLREAQETHQQELQATQTAREQEMRALSEQLESQHASEIQARNQEHLKDMAKLNRALFEVETKFTAAEEKIEKVEESEKSLKEALNQMTAELEAKAAELSAEQARHQEAFDLLKREHEQRYASVEERANSLQNSLEQASLKLDADNKSFERVREALAMGLGVIDQRDK
jgi:DNA-binding response OmpR family regulator